jgi:hypothetical protein
MPKHTPGPWFVKEIKVMHGVAHDISSADSPIVNDVQRLSDAHLIAAAPDLLLACKLALSSCDPHAATTRLIEAAIAKAEGK